MLKSTITRTRVLILTLALCLSIVPQAFAQGNTSPAITVLAGGESRGNRDGVAVTSLLSEPVGMAVDENGVIYFCDSGNAKIRTMSNGILASYAGIITPKNVYGVSVGGFVDGDAATKAVFSRPTDIKVGGGIGFIVDSGNHAVRVVIDGKVSTLAGGGKPGYKNGTGIAAQFNSPTSIAFGDNGMIYISDTQNQVIRAVDSTGKTTTVAGTPRVAGYMDGAALSSRLCEPKGLCYYNGTLYIADSGNQRIRALRDGVLSTVAGSGMEKFPESDYYVGGLVDGAADKARFSNPSALCADATGALYIADTNNGAIRRFYNGQVTTLLADDTLVAPEGLLLSGGSLIVSDSFRNKIFSIELYSSAVIKGPAMPWKVKSERSHS